MAGKDASPCELLRWDTAFFGFRVARVRADRLDPARAEQIDRWCIDNDIGCLYFLACSTDASTCRAAEDNHYRLVDIRVTLTNKEPDQAQWRLAAAEPSDAVVRQVQSQDVQVLVDLACKSHRDSRFYYDLNFPPRLSEALYETWMKRSCDGYADAVLVAELDESVVGYVSCHLDREHLGGRIGLAGVAGGAQSQGVGQKLVDHALEWFAAHGAREVSVVTQGRNCAAQRLYQRCGFLTQQTELWYHKWYLPGTGEVTIA